MDGLRQLAARIGQEHTAAAPLEQRDAQVVLEQSHRAADRAVSQAQLVGGTAEILVTRRRLEATQRHQRRQVRANGL